MHRVNEFTSTPERTAPAFFALPSSQFVGRCASEGTASGYHPAAQRRGQGPGRPRPQRLPPSVSVSSSGAARRKSLPVAGTPWRSAERKAMATCRIEHLLLLSTRLLPNPSVNATRTSRRLGARGRPALSSASRPKPPAGTGALPQTLGLGSTRPTRLVALPEAPHALGRHRIGTRGTRTLVAHRLWRRKPSQGLHRAVRSAQGLSTSKKQERAMAVRGPALQGQQDQNARHGSGIRRFNAHRASEQEGICRPWHFQRPGQAALQELAVFMVATRPRPNPSVNATRNSRRLWGARHPGLSCASRPKPPAAAGALPRTLGRMHDAS